MGTDFAARRTLGNPFWSKAHSWGTVLGQFWSKVLSWKPILGQRPVTLPPSNCVDEHRLFCCALGGPPVPCGREEGEGWSNASRNPLPFHPFAWRCPSRSCASAHMPCVASAAMPGPEVDRAMAAEALWARAESLSHFPPEAAAQITNCYRQYQGMCSALPRFVRQCPLLHVRVRRSLGQTQPIRTTCQICYHSQGGIIVALDSSEL